jgi:S-adenosylmethionine decarboxylase
MGIHIIAEIHGVRPGKISKVEDVQPILDKTLTKFGLNVISSTFHQFQPYGVSGVYLLGESHLSIHTWPEYGYVALDIFTCRDDDSALNVFDAIVKKLQPKSVEKQIIRREILGKNRG